MTNPLVEHCLKTEPPKGFGFIYQVEFPCGKVYIGQTVNSVWKRMQGHGKIPKDSRTRINKVPPYVTRLFLRSDPSRIVVTIVSCVRCSELDYEESLQIALRQTKFPKGANKRPGKRTWGKPIFGDMFGESEEKSHLM